MCYQKQMHFKIIKRRTVLTFLLMKSYHEVWSKNNRYFQFFSKDIYLFINNYLVPFKVTPLVYNTPTLNSNFRKWNVLFDIANSPYFDFSFISSIVAKPIFFIHVFSFGKRNKSAVAKSLVYLGWDMIMVLFSAKNSSTIIYLSWYDIMVQNPWLVFPQFCAFLMTCYTQAEHNGTTPL